MRSVNPVIASLMPIMLMLGGASSDVGVCGEEQIFVLAPTQPPPVSGAMRVHSRGFARHVPMAD